MIVQEQESGKNTRYHCKDCNVFLCTQTCFADYHSRLKPFEEDVVKLLENIKFRYTKNHFQHTLENNLKKINSSDIMFVFADKTRNIRNLARHIQQAVTRQYYKKRGSEDNISEIDNELNHITNKLSFWQPN